MPQDAREMRAVYRLSRYAQAVPVRGTGVIDDGRTFALVSDDLAMPPTGSAYIVEVLEDKMLEGFRVAIEAYIDRNGRVYATHNVVKETPGRTCDVRLLESYRERDRGVVRIFGDTGTYFDAALWARSARKYSLEFSRISDESHEGEERLTFDELAAWGYLVRTYYATSGGEFSEPETMLDCLQAFQKLPLSRAITEVLALCDGATSRYTPTGIFMYLAHSMRVSGSDVLLEALKKSPAQTDIAYAGSDSVHVRFLFADAHAYEPKQLEALLAVESAVNRVLDISRNASHMGVCAQFWSEAECLKADMRLLEGAAKRPYDIRRDYVRPESPFVPHDAQVGGAWDTRVRFSIACESMDMPIRMPIHFRLAQDNTLLVVDAKCPELAVMPALGINSDGNVDLAADEVRATVRMRFGLHAAIRIAAAAFASSGHLETVVVNGRVSDLKEVNYAMGRPISQDEAYAYSIKFERDAFYDYFTTEFANSFSDISLMLDTFEHRVAPALGEFLPVEPLMTRASCASEEAQYHIDPAIDERVLPQALAQKLGVSKPSELAVSDKRAREPFAKEACAALGGGTHAVIDALRDIHDRCEDVSVRHACVRLIEHFLESGVDELSELAIYDGFNDPYGMEEELVRAETLRNEDPEAALGVAESAIARIEGNPWFTSSSQVRCAAFGGEYATRMLDALDHAGSDTRPVRLLPDELFALHALSAYVLAESQGNSEDFARHANRCAEIAPSVPFGHIMRGASFLSTGDIRGACACYHTALEHVISLDEAAGIYFRLAGAYHFLGKVEVALACYTMFYRIGTTVGPVAVLDIAAILRENPKLSFPVDDPEKILDEADVPYRAVVRNVSRMMEVACGFAEMGQMNLASNLAASGMRGMREGVLAETVDSMLPLRDAKGDKLVP